MKSEDKVKEQRALSTQNIESRARGDRRQYSEDLLKIFATNSLIGIAVIQDGKIKFTNPQFQKLLGYNEDELRDMNHLNLVLPEDKNLVEEAITKTLKAQSTCEHRFVSKAGEIGWVIETLTPIQFQGRPAVLVHSMDISERKRMEEALRQSGEKFAKAFRSSPDPITLTTLEDGRYIELNDAYVDLIGYGREEAIGCTACELGFWSKPEERSEMLRLLQKHGAVRNLEVWFGVKSGEKRFGLLSVERIDLAGKPCLISVVHDITERRRLEEALRDSEEFSSSLLSNSPNPILVINPDTSVRYVNPALEKLTGFSCVKLIGKKPPYPWWTDETSHEKSKDLEKAMHNGVRRMEELFQKKDGEQFWIEITSTPVVKGGKLKYYLANWIDITEQKRLRDNMQFYIAESIKAQEEERKRIARELHDETVQSLASLHITLHNMMVADKQLSEDTKLRLERLGITIDRIMEEVRRFSHELRPGLLDKLGLKASLGFLVEEMKAGDNIRCHVEVIGSEQRLSPESEVILFRIAQEALHNVVKHSKATNAMVTVEFTRKKVRLSIIDNGTGFKVPRRLGNLARKSKLGIIGMSERARLLNGSFCMNSKPGKGTVVTVELSLKVSQ